MKRVLILFCLSISLVLTAVWAQPGPPPPPKPKPGPPPATDTCNYPYTDALHPNTSVAFNESAVLRAGGLSADKTKIIAWYNDEHALTLGISAAGTLSGKTFSPFETSTVTPFPGCPGCTASPALTGLIDLYGHDPSGRPFRPSLFFTDVNTNTTAPFAGDWQIGGGNGVPPDAVYGTWKSAVIQKSGTTLTYVGDTDPTKNNWSYLPDTPTGGFAGLTNEGYGAEIVWLVSNLGLTPGHPYRFQFMVHDGDQHSDGGDVGEMCTTLTAPPPVCTPSTSTDGVTLAPGAGGVCVCTITQSGTTTYPACNGSNFPCDTVGQPPDSFGNCLQSGG